MTGSAMTLKRLLTACFAFSAVTAQAVPEGYLDGLYECSLSQQGKTRPARLSINSHRDGRLIYILAPTDGGSGGGHGSGRAVERTFAGTTAAGQPFSLAIGQIEVDGGAGLEQVTLNGTLGKVPAQVQLNCRSAW